MSNLIKQIYSITAENPNGETITVVYESEESANTNAIAALDKGLKVLKIKMPLYP